MASERSWIDESNGNRSKSSPSTPTAQTLNSHFHYENFMNHLEKNLKA